MQKRNRQLYLNRKMAFQQIAQSVTKTNPDKNAEMELLSRIITESAEEFRSISHQMMSRALSELGLIPAIEDMLEKSLSPNNFEYEFEHFGVEDRLPENIEISLFRILQELINNIVKHSKASHVSIQLPKNNHKIIMIVEDNGEGFKSYLKLTGHGLLNIKSRLNTVHGNVNYEPSSGSGTTATIRIPLD